MGRYAMYAYNDPKKYPKKPWLYEEPRKEPMTPEEMERVIRRNNRKLNKLHKLKNDDRRNGGGDKHEP